MPGAFSFAAVNLGVHFLNVGAVAEHDAQQVAGCACGIYFSPKPVPDQERQPSAVVNVRVGHQHGVNLRRIKRKAAVFLFVQSLVEAAVNQDGFPAGLKAVAASGYRLVRSEKHQFHKFTPSFCSSQAQFHRAVVASGYRRQDTAFPHAVFQPVGNQKIVYAPSGVGAARVV